MVGKAGSMSMRELLTLYLKLGSGGGGRMMAYRSLFPFYIAQDPDRGMMMSSLLKIRLCMQLALARNSLIDLFTFPSLGCFQVLQVDK